jgi:hypothetical protein
VEGCGVLTFGPFSVRNLVFEGGILTNFRARSVPVSNLPRLVYETKKDAKSEGIEATIVRHVGDGMDILSSQLLARAVSTLMAYE